MGKYLRISGPTNRREELVSSIQGLAGDPDHRREAMLSNIYTDDTYMRIRLRVDSSTYNTQTRSFSNAADMAKADRRWSRSNLYPMKCVPMDEWLENPDPQYWRDKI